MADTRTHSIRSVNAETLKSWMEKSEQIILMDAGGLLACQDARIPGARCLSCHPEEDSSFLSSLSKESKIVVYSAYRPIDPDDVFIRQILSAGHKNVFFLNGGLAAWRKAGYPVVSEKRIPRLAAPALRPADLSRWQKEVKNPLVIDIRPAGVYAAKHLEGAVNMPLEYLHRQYADIPLDRTLLVVDEDGRAGFLAASYLARKGFSNVQRLWGGMAACRQGAK